MKLNLKKLLSSLLCLAMILGSLSSGIYTFFVHAEKAPEYTIFAHGGSISYTYIADKFSGTAVEGSVLTITYNETEYEGKTFDYWKADTGETIPQKSFELLVDQDIYFFPVFKQTDANFSPWTLFDERNCAEGDIYVREDIENALREYKRVYKNNGYHEYGNYKCLNETEHYTVCSICGDENIEPHSWDYGEITVKPTHDIEGIKVYTCTFCGATKTEIISNEDAHDMSDWIVVEEAKNGNVGIRKKVCDCGYTEQSYYVEAEWERFYQDHYIEFDTKSFVMTNTTDRDERHYSYINSDGNKSYIYAIKMDDRDSEQTYALMFVDDPLLAVKPIYMAKSDSNNGHKGFDWSIYAYAHDFYGYMEIVNGMDHSKRASSFTFNGREWADYYNSYNFKEKGQLPSGCYYERDLEYLGMECRQYAIYNDDDKTDLYKVYYVTKDSNVTVFIENYKARTNRSVTEYKPIASDEEYDAMDQDTQKKYLKKSDISKSVRELNKNDSRRDLVINEDRPEKSQYYSMNVSSHGNSGYSYDYNYYGTTILSHYYYGIIFGYPDNPFEVGIDDLYKVNFFAEDRPGYEFDYWEIYDWETQTWDFFSDDIDYACNYVKLNSNRTEYIEDTRIKDATKVRAVYREAPPCHVRVEGGFFTENYTVTNVSEGDVLKGINIYIIPDRNRIPEGKELDYWEASINGGEVIRIDLGSITVTGDMVLTPVYKDIICDVYFYGEGGEVTDDFSECSMGATITVKTTANEGYTTFLGWYKLNFGMDRIEYELITTSTTLSYVVDEDYIQFIARWSDGTINEEPYCDITIDNGFGSRGYNGIFVSSLRLGDYSRVTMVKDPYQTGIVSKWTVTGQFDDGIDYYEEIYDIFEDESEYFIYSCADLPEKITITAVMAQCTEHDWDEGVITKPASHIEEGIITYTCLFCGEKRIEVIPKTSEHTYGRWQKHNAEQHMRVCECGDIEYADHNWDNGVITTAATHTTAGVRTFTCSECGETKTEDIEPTSEHTYGRWQKHNAEQHMRVCECGDIEYADHNWDNGVITTAATHTTAGVRTFTCSECGETKTEDIEPTSEHTYGRWQKHNAEQHMRVCECGDIEYADHNWDNGVITTAATHTTAGVRTFTCSECGETKTEDIEPTSEHTYGRWQKHNAEQHMRVCECGDIEYADHNWDNGKPSEDGSGIVFTCTVCEAIKTVACENHQFSDWQQSDTEHYRTCSLCGKIERGVHDYTGSTDNSCIICGFKEQGKIYHDIDNQNNALNAELQVNESTDLDALILNDDDRERVGSGEDVRISLEVSDATEIVSADEKAKIQSVLGNNFVGLYLDINLYKQIGTDEKQKVAETNGKVCITIKIPDELISKTTIDYIYKIVRVHEGKAEILEGIFNPETKTFVFETDQFSLYALIYSEAESEADTSDDISNNTDPEGSPQTGDGRNIALTAFLTLFALGSLAIANMNRRKRKKV